MVDILNGIGLGTLSSGYLNTASQVAQGEAATIFASLAPSADQSTATDSAAFSLASLAALADGGASFAAQEAAASTSSDGTAQTTIPSAGQTQQTLLDSFAGVPSEPLVSLPAPALASTTTDPGTPVSGSASTTQTI
jgi:hypothetical protein